MRPVVLHHLMIALFSCLANISAASPTPSTSMSSSVFRRSPSITSIGSQLLPSFSTNSCNNISSPSRSTASTKDSNTSTSSPSASTMAYKMCSLIFDIFTSLCLLSGGCYDIVMAVVSEVKGEQYRFERLVQSLHDLGVHHYGQKTVVSKFSSMIEEQQELLVFDCVASALSFLNAIVQTPESVEKRDSLRTELERRGFEDVLKRLDIKRNVLPDSLRRKIDAYVKQKKFDQDKIRALESTKRQSILQL